MAKKSTDKSDYGADSITVLEGLDPVRKRPGMYIGTTGPDGLHHLVWEVFDNSRDEAMSGFADDIEVALLPHDRVRVVDNGRGIPVGIHKLTKVSALETVMTTLHAGGKFDNDSYKVSGGLHGVGVSVVNALSVYARAEVHQDGGAYFQEYSQGKKKAPLKKIGASKLHGTIITFEPDVEIFKEVQFDFNKIVSHLRQQAYLVKKMHITVLDLRAVDEKQLKLDGVFYARDLRLNAPSMSFYFEGGLQSLITFYNHHQQPLHKNIFYCEKLDIDANVVSVEIALQYVDDINSRITAFANNIYNAEGGTHLTGFKTALTRSLKLSFVFFSSTQKNSQAAVSSFNALSLSPAFIIFFTSSMTFTASILLKSWPIVFLNSTAVSASAGSSLGASARAPALNSSMFSLNRP
ncbi:MAG: gyrase subunit B protein [Candidatus Magasanikbacteria bacterium GW2011_GWE2_42_7]|uniref:DNA topoisomerase (ATP-hydrolyzing) n=1 Tax=Candidatus Magasanikbacteria bacterium GW2011_GWE2_42_7 TaxID=1619052 RepID=A0A0G1DHN0_9BACT|nr:MAG: gyrase subunit B protein [Candidatus Magasanikbacteria bacterium GW2011_GWE2_42_7]